MSGCPYSPVSFRDAVPLEQLLRHVMPHVPDIPYAMALDKVRQAYIEFARRSEILVGKLVMDWQAGVHDYYITPPEGYDTFRILGLDSPNYRYVDYWAGQCHGLWNTRFDVVDNRAIYFHTAPSVDNPDGLAIYASLVPNSCCNTIPSSVEVPYGEAIAEGALARILLIPGKPWSNANLSRVHNRNFHIGVMSARNLADTNRKRGPLMAKPVRIV